MASSVDVCDKSSWLALLVSPCFSDLGTAIIAFFIAITSVLPMSRTLYLIPHLIYCDVTKGVKRHSIKLMTVFGLLVVTIGSLANQNILDYKILPIPLFSCMLLCFSYLMAAYLLQVEFSRGLPHTIQSKIFWLLLLIGRVFALGAQMYSENLEEKQEAYSPDSNHNSTSSNNTLFLGSSTDSSFPQHIEPLHIYVIGGIHRSYLPKYALRLHLPLVLLSFLEFLLVFFFPSVSASQMKTPQLVHGSQIPEWIVNAVPTLNAKSNTDRHTQYDSASSALSASPNSFSINGSPNYPSILARKYRKSIRKSHKQSNSDTSSSFSSRNEPDKKKENVPLILPNTESDHKDDIDPHSLIILPISMRHDNQLPVQTNFSVLLDSDVTESEAEGAPLLIHLPKCPSVTIDRTTLADLLSHHSFSVRNIDSELSFVALCGFPERMISQPIPKNEPLSRTASPIQSVYGAVGDSMYSESPPLIFTSVTPHLHTHYEQDTEEKTLETNNEHDMKQKVLYSQQSSHNEIVHSEQEARTQVVDQKTMMQPKLQTDAGSLVSPWVFPDEEIVESVNHKSKSQKRRRRSVNRENSRKANSKTETNSLPPHPPLWAFLMCTFVSQVGENAHIVMVPLIMFKVASSMTLAAFLVAVCYLTEALGALIGGRVMNRLNPRVLLCVSLFLRTLTLTVLSVLIHGIVFSFTIEMDILYNVFLGQRVIMWVFAGIISLDAIARGAMETSRSSIPLLMSGKQKQLLDVMNSQVMIVFELGVLMGPILESILLELASEVSSDLSDTDYRFTIHMTTAFAVACSVAPFFFLLASILALFVPKVSEAHKYVCAVSKKRDARSRSRSMSTHNDFSKNETPKLKQNLSVNHVPRFDQGIRFAMASILSDPHLRMVLIGSLATQCYRLKSILPQLFALYIVGDESVSGYILSAFGLGGVLGSLMYQSHAKKENIGLWAWILVSAVGSFILAWAWLPSYIIHQVATLVSDSNSTSNSIDSIWKDDPHGILSNSFYNQSSALAKATAKTPDWYNGVASTTFALGGFFFQFCSVPARLSLRWSFQLGVQESYRGSAMGIYRASAVVSGFIFESTAALSVSSKIVKRPIPTPFTPYNQNSSAIIEKKSIFEGVSLSFSIIAFSLCIATIFQIYSGLRIWQHTIRVKRRESQVFEDPFQALDQLNMKEIDENQRESEKKPEI